MYLNRICILAFCSLALAACGGGGGGGGGGGSSSGSDVQLSSVTVGIEMPSELSAVPADNSEQSTKTSYKTGSFAAALQTISRAASTSELPTTSDYAKAEPSVYVEERALKQFDIVEQIFKAIDQTNYADEENVNNGPYKAMIAWEEEQDGKEIKTLETWTVESQMIIMSVPSNVTGNTTGDVNRLYAWVPETNRETGQEQLVKAEILIYTAPDKAADGSLLNYGEWDMNVLMNANPDGVDTIGVSGPQKYFAASARIGTDGTSILKVHDRWSETMDMDGPGGSDPMQISEEMKGILYRDGTTGYGQVSYPDWEACWQWDGMGTAPCESGIPTNVAKYAYNANYLGVQEINDGVAGSAVYKDRDLNGAIRLVHRYGLFYANADANAGIAEGDRLTKHVKFGFPVSFEQTATGDNSVTFNDFGYYGAWQGRHQLWAGGTFTATTNGTDGTTFTRQDVPPGQTAPTYKLKEFAGTFTKRSMVEARLDDIKNVAVETWLNDDYQLFYFDPDAGGTLPADWQYCTGWLDWSSYDPMATPPTCRDKEFNNDIGFEALHGVDGSYGGGDDSELVAQLPVASNDRRYVNINRCDQFGCTDYVYLTSDPGTVTWSGAGFYQAEWGMEGLQPVNGATRFTGSAGNEMWVNIGGSIYVAYTGDFSGATTDTGWVQKTLLDFDEETWTPTFDNSADIPFTPDRGYQYYMHANGQNYVVTRTDADVTAGFQEGDFSAKLELQTAATPANTDSVAAASILPTGTVYLAEPWNNDVKYTLVEDPTNPNYLLLVVAHDASGATAAGTVATNNMWGLVAYYDANSDTNLNTGAGFSDDVPMASDGSALTVDEWGWVDPAMNSGKQPVEFNWEFADELDSWGKQQFLVYFSDPPAGSSIGDYAILSDPINLNQVGLYDNLGNPAKADPTGADVVVGGDESNWKKVNLQFDGWMHGLPDLYHELEINGWTFTADMASKVRRLLEGQKVTDSNGIEYFVKPMETSLFLGVVTAFPKTPGQPDVSAADSVDLNSVPEYSAHNMGAIPTTDDNGNPIVVKYSEGDPIE